MLQQSGELLRACVLVNSGGSSLPLFLWVASAKFRVRPVVRLIGCRLVPEHIPVGVVVAERRSYDMELLAKVHVSLLWIASFCTEAILPASQQALIVLS